MSAHHTHQEITSRLKALSDQLSKGDLSEDELKEFEILSRRIYERAIVLNYKAKEAHVYSKSVSNELVDEETSKTEEIEKKESSSAKSEVFEKEPEESGEIAFDFSSDEPRVEPSITPSRQEEKAVQVEKTVEPEVKHESEVESEPKSTEHVPEEKTASFFEKFTKVHDDSLMSKLGASKLDTLKGAIGLNDKMQFISELFDGSSDRFNEAIDQLDQQQSNEKARFYLSQIAVKQSWDVEDPLVEEFVRILDRRYAE